MITKHRRDTVIATTHVQIQGLPLHAAAESPGRTLLYDQYLRTYNITAKRDVDIPSSSAIS